MKWLEPKSIPVSDDLMGLFPGSFFLAEQLALRNIHTAELAEEFLDPKKYREHSPYAFTDMEKITDRICSAIKLKQKIGIWGDFDADGQTSAALLTDSLKRLGADVSFYIPIRALESHGIQKGRLKEFLNEGIHLLITCDTGITEFEALDYAHASGVDVIISDHHTPDQNLPASFGIINPCFLPNGHAMRDLAGVGTAFQILRALLEKENMSGQIGDYYDLVALGTVADLANLTNENRFYTQMGLKSMEEKMRPALAAMLEAAGISSVSIISESLISYTLAPRLNAVGRLSDANINVSFLLSEDQDFIQKTALQLEILNVRRKAMVDAVFSSCINMLEKQKELLQYPGIVLAAKNWEKGVIGIAASRLVEKYHKPVILLCAEDDISFGSARSVEGINIIRAIRENKNLLLKFGGHPMAAGLALKTNLIPEFREALASTILTIFADHDPEKKLQIDGYAVLSNLNSRLSTEINQLAPFGPANHPPVLVSRNLEIESSTSFGKHEAHQKLILVDSQGETRQSIWWNASQFTKPQGKLDLAFFIRPDPNDTNNGVILEWVDHQEAQSDAITLYPRKSKYHIFDYRSSVEKAEDIVAQAGLEKFILWGEGIFDRKDSQVRNRLQLIMTNTLIILFAPPDASTLTEALQKTSPKEIYLFSDFFPDDTLKGFIRNLAGLIKYSIRSKDGVTSLDTLAAVMGHTKTTIFYGIQWWKANGDIDFLMDGDTVNFFHPSTRTHNRHDQISRNLQQSLSETAAFRSYYLRTNPDFLFSSNL